MKTIILLAPLVLTHFGKSLFAPIIPEVEVYVDTNLNILGKLGLSIGWFFSYGHLFINSSWSFTKFGKEDLYSKVLEERNNFGINLQMRMGGLYAVSDYNIFSNRPNGSIGFIFNLGKESIADENISSGQMFTVAITPFHQTTVLRWVWDIEYFFPKLKDSAIENLFNLRVGFQNGANFTKYYSTYLDETEIIVNYRFIKIFCGTEINFLKKTNVALLPYFYADTGFRLDMSKTDHLFKTELLNKNKGAFMEFGCGARFTPCYLQTKEYFYKYFFELETGATIPFYKRDAGSPVLLNMSLGFGCAI